MGRNINLAFDGVFDFSSLPLRMVALFGLLLVATGFLALMTGPILKLFFIEFQAGLLSLFGSILLEAGINIYFIDVVPIYIGKIYREVKGRPLFSIKEMRYIQS